VGRKTNKQRKAQVGASAREKAAAARLEQQRTDQRRRALAVLSTVVVIVLVAVGIFAYVLTRPTKSDPSGDRVATAAATVLKDVGSVSNATLQTIGKGTVLTMPTKVTGEPPLTAGGKPEMLYIGAEFCPYCAAERWAIYESLSKFGTFSGVGEVKSAKSDGDYSSLDFYKSSFTSKYLNFTSVENEDRNRHTLQKVTTAQNALWAKLSGGDQGFPFIDFGNEYDITNAPLDPTVLGTLSQEQIASQLNDPTSPVAKTIGGGANDITAAVCTMTRNLPASVCLQPQITNLQSELDA
jgi:thiol-disulfide isomerase/thioredoxin